MCARRRYEYLATSFKAFTMPVVQSTARVCHLFSLSNVHYSHTLRIQPILSNSFRHLDVLQQDQTFIVLDSVPAHGRALLHRLPLTRCQFLVRRHVVPARLSLTRCRSLVRRLLCGDMSCQLDWVAMFDAGNVFHRLLR